MSIPTIFRRRWFLFLFAIVAIFGIYLYAQNRNQGANTEQTVQVTRVTLKEVVSTQGKITAASQARLAFQTGGKLVWVGVKKGDYVQKWQAIASLDQSDLQTRFKKALLAYQSKRIDFDGTVDENEESIINRNGTNIQTMGDEDQSIMRLLQQNQITLDQSVKDVELASIAKQYGTLYSPIDGIVIEASDENAGVNISIATTHYTVVDPSSLRFQAEVEEVDIANILTGQSATVTLDALPDQPFTTMVASVDFNSTTTSTGNTAYNVYLPLTLDQRLRLDLSGTAEILVSEKINTLAVPSEAVLEDETGPYIINKSEKGYEKLYIKIGVETDEYYEVLEGLSEGQKVILPNAEIEKKINE